MSTIKSERLRQAREKAGFESAAAAAQAFNWNESGYRHHENGTRSFGADLARKYGMAFKVKPAWLLGIDADPELPYTPVSKPNWLVVNGSVEAGVFRESEHWDDDRAFMIVGSQPIIPGARRFGLLTEGRSMDQIYEPGTVLDCASIFDVDVEPETGDHVIVERVKSDGLRELTVKEYRRENGRHYLVPRSTRPGFETVELPGPTEGTVDDEHVRVIAFVVGSIPPRTLELLRRMKKVRPLT